MTETDATTHPALAPPPSTDMFGATLLFSLIVHGIVILGVGFDLARPEPRLPTLDVTLVNTANRQAPEHADFLAQANNAGGGNSDRATRPSQPFSSPLPQPDPGVAPQPLEAQAPEPVAASEVRRVSTRDSHFSVSTGDDQQAQADNRHRRADIHVERRLEMARLAAEINAATEAEAKRPHRKYISASTREYAYAAYMRAWAQRIERVGTLNFPDAARTSRLNGNLILTVAIRRDGSIRSIDVIESSGRKVLDDAAMRIVRLAAPFPPIPLSEQQVDELYITRTYQFLSSGSLQTH